jgi:phosphonate transport system substrate-binding protein
MSRFLAFSAWLCVLVACDRAVPPAEEGHLDLAGRQVIAAWTVPSLQFQPVDLPAEQTRLRLGVTPYLARHLLHAQFQPLAAALQADTGVPIDLVVADTYESLVQRVANGTVDIALLSPLSYVEARQRDPKLQLLARTLSYGSIDYSSYIVVRAEDGYQTLRDLAGHAIAWVDPLSTSGFLFPYEAFLEAGLDPEHAFSHVEWAGTHTAALKALLDRRVDAAAISSGTLAEDQTGAAAEVRILYKAGRIPYDAVCARSGLPASGARKLAVAFQRLDTRTRHGRDVLAHAPGISGWVATTDDVYDEVRTVAAQVEAHRHPGAMKPPTPATPPLQRLEP